MQVTGASPEAEVKLNAMREEAMKMRRRIRLPAPVRKAHYPNMQTAERGARRGYRWLKNQHKGGGPPEAPSHILEKIELLHQLTQ